MHYSVKFNAAACAPSSPSNQGKPLDEPTGIASCEAGPRVNNRTYGVTYGNKTGDLQR